VVVLTTLFLITCQSIDSLLPYGVLKKFRAAEQLKSQGYAKRQGDNLPFRIFTSALGAYGFDSIDL
jgi:hypothetical protein